MVVLQKLYDMKLNELIPELQDALNSEPNINTREQLYKEITRAYGASEISIWASCTLFWMVYPLEMFDVMKYYRLFKINIPK